MEKRKPVRGVCVGCGCTHTTPCLTHGEPCSWVDREKTVCSACFAWLGYSSVEENVRYIRKATSVPLLERCRAIFAGERESKTRLKAVEIRLRALGKVSAVEPERSNP